RAEAPVGATASASAALVASAMTVLRNISFLLMRMPSGHSPFTRGSIPPGPARAPPMLIATRHRRRPCALLVQFFRRGIAFNLTIALRQTAINKYSSKKTNIHDREQIFMKATAVARSGQTRGAKKPGAGDARLTRSAG